MSQTQRSTRDEQGDPETGELPRTKERETAAAAYRIQVDGNPEDPEYRHTLDLEGFWAERGDGQKRSTAFLSGFKSIPRAACRYIDDLLDEALSPYMADPPCDYFLPHTKYVFKHILVCGSTWTDGDDIGWVPVPARLLQRKKPGARLEVLVGCGLLEMKEHSRERGLCREYRVDASTQHRYNQLVWENLQGRRWDLFTSKRTRRSEKSQFKDRTGNLFPQIVRVAMRQIERNGLFNAKAAEDVIDAHEYIIYVLESMVAEAFRKGRTGIPSFDEDHRLLLKMYARLQNDIHCLDAIVSNRTNERADGVIEYRVPYRPTSTGRISFLGGGAQSCTREMKAAGYDGLCVYNYDIKSSQPSILINDFLREAELPAGWLQSYLQHDKKDFAQKAGLSVDGWKTCLIALMMGATLPKSENIKTSEGALRDAIEDDVGAESLTKAYDAFRTIVEPLYEDSLKPWHEFLVRQWIPSNAESGHAGRRYVHNAIGMSFCVDDYPRHVLGRKVAAFLLQGKESFFIHTLTALAQDYGFTVVANEHDGLVTLEEIPYEAVEEAKASCRMPYVELVQKGFVWEHYRLRDDASEVG